jgi:PucR C-terminal helix-turn-helix domain/GGDEF-like domain
MVALGGRALHRAMIAAVIAGSGLDTLAELASAEARAPIAIVVPRRVDAIHPPYALAKADLERLREYVAAQLSDRPTSAPATVVAEAPVTLRKGVVGAVLLLAGGDAVADARNRELLAITAMATTTGLALGEAREDAGVAAHGSLIARIRGDPRLSDTAIIRRAGRLGSDLSAGAVALCAAVTDGRRADVIATILSEHPGSLAEEVDDRVYALLPPDPDADPAQPPLESAYRIAELLASDATVGFSSFCSQPGLFHRALTEAELVVQVLTHEADKAGEDIRSATYRLLISMLAKRPDDVMAFYEDTVAALVVHDAEHGAELVVTVDAYLRHNCNVSATAGALHAHRQTITSRLERIHELTGLDPKTSEGCELLSLGLKLHRILAPQLHP